MIFQLDRVYENGNSRSMTPEEVDRLKDYGVQLAEYSVSVRYRSIDCILTNHSLAHSIAPEPRQGWLAPASRSSLLL